MNGMAEFLLENWKLIATFLLAAFNFFLTLFVHSRSSKRLSQVESSTDPVVSGMSAVLEATTAILEILKNEKKNQ